MTTTQIAFLRLHVARSVVCLLAMGGVVFSSYALPEANVSDIAPVNVTPTEFSILGRAPQMKFARLVIYADPQGITSLQGQLGLESYPLHSGDPGLLTAYEQRQKQTALRQNSQSRNLIYQRVTQCRPDTTYYYRVFVTETNGLETVWPATTPLPEVTTALENRFVPQSKQLVVELPDDAEGNIVKLSSTNAAYSLAAVAGDGARTNQVVFTLSDLFDAGNQSNLLLVGSHEFSVEVIGGGSKFGAGSRYTLAFPEAFGVGGGALSEKWDTLFLGLGSVALQAGQSDYVTISLGSRSGLASVSFVLKLPIERFSNLTLQPIAPQVESVSLQPNANGTSLLSFAFRAGQTLTGTQELARISFTARPDQTSAIIPLQPAGFTAVKPDSSAVANSSLQDGRVVVIANAPILEIQSAPKPVVTIYGKPGSTYQLQFSTNLNNSAGWTQWTTVPMSNFASQLETPGTPSRTMFFRAREIAP